jgi:hypothetical protein
MSRLTFTHALQHAETLARAALEPALHQRLACAVTLVKDGHVVPSTDGTWQVHSSSTAGLVYTVNGTCTCDDVRFNAPLKGYCKHRLAVLLSRKVVQLMQPTPPALPEAPASVNVLLTIDGRQVQLTLRDHDEERLLERLQAILLRYPVEQSHGEGFCTIHNMQMKPTSKNGSIWYSHKTADGWCKGKVKR